MLGGFAFGVKHARRRQNSFFVKLRRERSMDRVDGVGLTTGRLVAEFCTALEARLSKSRRARCKSRRARWLRGGVLELVLGRFVQKSRGARTPLRRRGTVTFRHVRLDFSGNLGITAAVSKW